jgi:hypothetical protein
VTDPIGFALQDGLDLAGVELDEFWWRYSAVGGTADQRLLADRIAGRAPCERSEYNLIAQVLNECFVDRGMDMFPVAYRGEPLIVARQLDALMQGPRGSAAPSAARRRAFEARARSAAAAREAAALQLAAARLMRDSGQQVYARKALQRAAQAQARAIAATAAIA